jgi:hypothetical protein
MSQQAAQCEMALAIMASSNQQQYKKESFLEILGK